MYTHPNCLRRFSQKTYGIIETRTQDPFLDDKVRILESKAYRRLHGKAQVYCKSLEFTNSNIRDRAVHTNEVIALSSKIAHNLGLNVHLAEAIAAGHDIGHLPFGHLGEKVFSEYGHKPFKHDVFGVIIAQKIERKGKGLNLTFATLQGILNHSLGKEKIKMPSNITDEAKVVMLADKIAYTLSDINDARRMGGLKKVPNELFKLGKNQREREYKIVNALIKESKKYGKISFEYSPEAKLFSKIRDFMYTNVYCKQNRNTEEKILIKVIKFMHRTIKDINPLLLVAMMNDYEVYTIYKQIEGGKEESLKKLIQKKLKNLRIKNQFGFLENILSIKDMKFDIYDADLNEKDFKY